MKSVSLLMLFLSGSVFASTWTPNYDEGKVGDLDLPSLFLKKTDDLKGYWEGQRRAEIIEQFRDNVYGKQFKFNNVSVMSISDKKSLKGVDGYRQLIKLSLDGKPVELMLFMPSHHAKSAVFVGYNFCGNHSVRYDEDLAISTSWANPQVCGSKIDPTLETNKNNRFLESSRGVRAYRWPVEEIVNRGYGVATLYYGDVVADEPTQFKSFIKEHVKNSDSDKYSAIGVWSGGLTAVIDYLLTRSDVDSKGINVVGHSRLGKTALWTAAQDSRVSYVISNNSGEGGAAITRRNYGETLESITKDFPHWFAPKYASYAKNTQKLPIDQHMLISLIAPRTVYVASAREDQWADPKGEFLSLEYAKPVYKIYNKDVFSETEQPATGIPLRGVLNYHYREGGHDIFSYDWKNYLDVADSIYHKN